MNDVSRSFNSIIVIAGQEFNLFFSSPIVYIIGAVWLFLYGIFFVSGLLGMNQGFAEVEIGSSLAPMVFIMMLVAPALTMRSISGELRSGTHELLLTSPVHDWEIILGKWLAVVGVFSTVFVGLTIPFAVYLNIIGDPVLNLMVSAYIGLWLAGISMLAVGIFASSISQYQLVSFFVSLGILLVLWIFQLMNGFLTAIAPLSTLGTVVSQMSMFAHVNSFIQQAVITYSDIAYFVGMILIMLFLATQTLGSRRWRG